MSRMSKYHTSISHSNLENGRLLSSKYFVVNTCNKKLNFVKKKKKSLRI